MTHHTSQTDTQPTPEIPTSILTERIPHDIDPLTFTNISKTYGEITALQSLSATFDPGTCHCLAGPNGSGKTTIGQIAVGLTSPTTGSMTGTTQPIGYGFQTPRCYPSLTVSENITVFARSLDVQRDDPWVTNIMELLRLDRVAHQRTAALSGGFKKKLDLAVSLLSCPAFIWLDEPLGDLDDVSVSNVCQLLDAYTDAGGGVIIVTHNFDAFDTVCDTLTVFYDGNSNGPTPVNTYDTSSLVDAYRTELHSLQDSSPTPDTQQ